MNEDIRDQQVTQIPSGQPASEPDAPHWNAPVGILVWLASVAAIVLLPSLFVAAYAAASGIKFGDNQVLMDFATKDPGAIIAQISAIFPAHIITLAIAWAVVTRLGSRPFFETLGWTSGGIRWWHYAVMLMSFLAITAVASYLFPIKEDDMERIIRSSRTALYLIAAMAVLTAPIVEEVVYRGVLFSPLRQKLGPALAIAVVTALFTAVHVPQYAENPAKIIVLTVLSLGLTVLRSATGSLWPCVVLHVLVNATNAALLIAEPYIQPNVLDPAQTVMR